MGSEPEMKGPCQLAGRKGSRMTSRLAKRREHMVGVSIAFLQNDFTLKTFSSGRLSVSAVESTIEGTLGSSCGLGLTHMRQINQSINQSINPPIN